MLLLLVCRPFLGRDAATNSILPANSFVDEKNILHGVATSKKNLTACICNQFSRGGPAKVFVVVN